MKTKFFLPIFFVVGFLFSWAGSTLTMELPEEGGDWSNIYQIGKILPLRNDVPMAPPSFILQIPPEIKEGSTLDLLFSEELIHEINRFNTRGNRGGSVPRCVDPDHNLNSSQQPQQRVVVKAKRSNGSKRPQPKQANPVLTTPPQYFFGGNDEEEGEPEADSSFPQPNSTSQQAPFTLQSIPHSETGFPPQSFSSYSLLNPEFSYLQRQENNFTAPPQNAPFFSPSENQSPFGTTRFSTPALAPHVLMLGDRNGPPPQLFSSGRNPPYESNGATSQNPYEIDMGPEAMVTAAQPSYGPQGTTAQVLYDEAVRKSAESSYNVATRMLSNISQNDPHRTKILVEALDLMEKSAETGHEQATHAIHQFLKKFNGFIAGHKQTQKTNIPRLSQQDQELAEKARHLEAKFPLPHAQ